MADSKSTKTTEAPEANKKPAGSTDTDQPKQPSAGLDSQVADNAGISEGEVKALRDEAGLNQLAGHEANVLAWESTEAGKEFLKGNKDREKAAEDEQKAYDEQFKSDGLTEAEVKYNEAVKGSRKG